jgi:glutamyl/glutaminyl-tRNA synthetase
MKRLPENVRNNEIYNRLKNNSELKNLDKIEDKKLVSKLFPIIFDHISKWSDVDDMVRAGELAYFFSSPSYDATLLYWKGKEDKETTKKHLQWVLDKLTSGDEEMFSESEKIKPLIFDYATENGKGEVLWPLRVALSGKDKSPDPFTLLYILGKVQSLDRITIALKKLT